MWTVKIHGERFDWEPTFSDEASARTLYDKLKSVLLDDDGIANYTEIQVHDTMMVVNTNIIEYVLLKPPKQ